MFKSIASTVTGLALIAATSTVFAPEATAHILDQIPHTLERFSQPDCDKRPRACLIRKQDRLKTLSIDLDRSRSRLEMEYGRAAKVLTDNKALLGQNQLFLEQGRRMIKTAISNGPVSFAGESYPTKGQFRDQLELLFMEGQRLEFVVADAQSLHDSLNAARRNLIARRSEIQATLSILPSKLALLDARQSYAALTGDLKAIDDVLRAGEVGTDAIDKLLRNTQELAQAAAKAPSNNTDFNAWLSEGTAADNG